MGFPKLKKRVKRKLEKACTRGPPTLFLALELKRAQTLPLRYLV